jgi:atlastin
MVYIIFSESFHLLTGSKLKEGNRNDNKSPVEDNSEGINRNGFAWAGGQNRQTTGIWMWSEPFIRKVSSYPEPIAILLMDTQGMFDNETTMALTARIFGLSTLISSYQVLFMIYNFCSNFRKHLQIYNVDKRIQEDNLQHLALFSEYGRMALGENTPEEVSASSKEGESSTSTEPKEKADVAEEVRLGQSHGVL